MLYNLNICNWLPNVERKLTDEADMSEEKRLSLSEGKAFSK